MQCIQGYAYGRAPAAAAVPFDTGTAAARGNEHVPTMSNGAVIARSLSFSHGHSVMYHMLLALI